MDRIAISMTEFGELTMVSFDPTALQRQHTVHAQAIATNTKLLIKCRKKHQHQKTRLDKQNTLVEELDETTTKHTTVITTLMSIQFRFWITNRYLELLETFVEDLLYCSDVVRSLNSKFLVEEEFFELFESFEGVLSHSSDAAHSFDFNFRVEEEFFELLELS